MNLMRILARPMLAAPFIVAGIDAVSWPEAHRERAAKLFNLAEKCGLRFDFSPSFTDTITRSTGAMMTVCGCLLALGKMPRMSAAMLAALQVPLALSNYPFWEKEGAEKRADLVGFAGAAGLAGGAILAAADKGISRRACSGQILATSANAYASADACTWADRIAE